VKLTRRIVRVDTGSPDEDGCLMFADDRLVAVLVQLSVEHNSGLAGKWFLEHAFGSLDDPERPVFEDLDAAERWVASRLC
jgi:hypothetical protein